MMDSSMPSAQLQSAIELIDDQSNLFMGLIGGVAAMLVGAIVWGAISYFTEYQIGVGFLVGIAIKHFGKGKSPIYGISGAVLALIGCLLGNLLFYASIIAREEGLPFLNVFFLILLSPAAAAEIFTVAFDFMDILFYGLAAYTGFSTAMDIKRTRK